MCNQRPMLEEGLGGMENMNFLYNTTDYGQNEDEAMKTKHKLL